MTGRIGSGPAAVVTGAGHALPGVTSAGDLLALAATDPGPDAPEPVDPAARIGKKGLRYKDRATQLALVAASDALLDAGLLESAERGAPLTVPAASVGVVVSSNFGNLDSVCDVVQTIADSGGTRLLSPIITPNLSSNVIASELAIRFGLRGPNLMVCNGETSGLDAVGWAAALLAAGRAAQVLVVGAEPDTAPVRRLLGDRRPLDGAVALVLETAATAAARGRAGRAEVGGYVRAGGVAEVLTRLVRDTADPGAWYVPQGGAVGDDVLAGLPRHDLEPAFGAASGALGVLQCAAAVAGYDRGGRIPAYAVAGGDGADATAGLVLRPCGE